MQPFGQKFRQPYQSIQQYGQHPTGYPPSGVPSYPSNTQSFGGVPSSYHPSSLSPPIHSSSTTHQQPPPIPQYSQPSSHPLYPYPMSNPSLGGSIPPSYPPSQPSGTYSNPSTGGSIPLSYPPSQPSGTYSNPSTGGSIPLSYPPSQPSGTYSNPSIGGGIPTSYPPSQPSGTYSMLSPMQTQPLPSNIPTPIPFNPPSIQPQGMSQPGIAPPYVTPIIPEGVIPPSPFLIQSTFSSFPRRKDIDFKLPFGIVISPFASTGHKMPSVNFGVCDVIRCQNCRTYINPYVTFLDRGAFWQCNLCGKANPTPNEYYAPIDSFGRRVDFEERVELKHSVYEIIAPGEYMRRPPQPPCYVFVIDTSARAVKSGLVSSVAEGILNCLGSLPGGERAQIGFITFNSTVSFYQFRNDLKMPHLLSVPSLLRLFLPTVHEELLVNFKEHSEAITSFLSSLPLLFNITTDVDIAFGPAIEAAVLLLESMGGRIISFLSGLPSCGSGVLKNREDPKVFGSDTEHLSLNMATDFYKTLSTKCCLSYIGVDLFACGESYLDLASLSALCRWASGQLYHYPFFHSSVDGSKLKAEIGHNLLREQAFEGVLRIRGIPGVRFQQVIGNFFMRGQDLLSLPTININQVFTMSVVHEDKAVNADRLAIQCALLHSSSFGERRIRIINYVIPCTDSLIDLFSSCNSLVVSLLLAKQAVDVAIRNGEFIRTSCIEIMRSFKKHFGGASEADYPDNFRSFPLMMLGIIKSLAFRAGSDVRTDDRVAALSFITTANISSFESYIRPRLIPLHELHDSEGLSTPSGDINLPPELSLSFSSLSSSGAYLIDNGNMMMLRLGRYLNETFLKSCFKIHSLQGVDPSQLSLQTCSDSKPSPLRRITNIINYLRKLTSSFQTLFIFIEGDNICEAKFNSLLIEDKLNNVLSYSDFLRHIDVNSSH